MGEAGGRGGGTVRVWPAAVLGAALWGCAADPREGYSTRDVFSSDIRTVAVPMFENATFTPGIEAQVTEAVIKELQARTSWRVTESAGADAVLTGVVRGSDLSRLSVDPRTGLMQELGVRVSVDFDLRDNRTGAVLVSRRGFTAVDTFVPARGTGERLEVGQGSAVERLARDLVAQLRGANW